MSTDCCNKLEFDLSLNLFARDKGRLIPTPEATIPARDAEHILLGLNRFSGLAEDLQAGSWAFARSGRSKSCAECLGVGNSHDA